MEQQSALSIGRLESIRTEVSGAAAEAAPALVRATVTRPASVPC